MSAGAAADTRGVFSDQAVSEQSNTAAATKLATLRDELTSLVCDRFETCRFSVFSNMSKANCKFCTQIQFLGVIIDRHVGSKAPNTSCFSSSQ